MEGFTWSQIEENGRLVDAPVAYNKTLQCFLCRSCWDGFHHGRGGKCPHPECNCGCYDGRNNGLASGIAKPHKDRKEQMSIPPVGCEFIGIKS